MPDQIPYIRIFVSSPGDVPEERKIAQEIIEQLPYRPALRDKVAFRIIAWDKPGADTPMRGSMSPQAAIDLGLPKPSECDITVVILWSRMGTPFIYNGVRYLSGTHYELMDALSSASTETIIFRRTEKKLFDPRDNDGIEQYLKVDDFFNSDLFNDPVQKVLLRGVNNYATAEGFLQSLETFLELLTLEILDASRLEPIKKKPLKPESSLPASLNIVTVEPVPWPKEKSPFPGLRALKEDDAEIHFGRGRETNMLLRRIATERFLAVVGASGSGKSSLVGAGLIPRLRANAVSGETIGSKDWFIVSLKPGNAPFEALAAALMGAIPALASSGARNYPAELEEFTAALREKPSRLAKTLAYALKDEKPWAEVLLFIDQFEEIFTLVNPDTEEALRFAAMLMDASQSEKVRFIITMRDDFFHRANAYQDLSELLQSGSFPLTIPRRDMLRSMIERPAERAGLELELGLVEQILDDTGEQPGSLALMAYLLDELYKLTQEHNKRMLTMSDYRMLGGVKDAIGARAESSFTALPIDEARKIQALQRVFRGLIELDERGTATRQRAPLTQIAADPDTSLLVLALTEARLLVQGAFMNTRIAYVEVAHEALFQSWPRLAKWIENTHADLWLLKQVQRAADEWNNAGQDSHYLWSHERLAPVYVMRERLQVEFDPILTEFTRPEAERLCEEYFRRETKDHRCLMILDRLIEIGLSTVPLWIEIITFKRHLTNVIYALEYRQDIGLPVFLKAFEMLESLDWETATAIMESFAEFESPEVVPVLRVAMNMRHVAPIAIKALFKRRDPAILPLLERDLWESNLDRREDALDMLGQVADPEAVRILGEGLHSSDILIATGAALKLAHLSQFGSIEVLQSALITVKNNIVVKAIRNVLAEIKHPAASRPLVTALGSPHETIRYNAIQGLRGLKRTIVIPKLLERVCDPDLIAREAATELLIDLIEENHGDFRSMVIDHLVDWLYYELDTPLYIHILTVLGRLGGRKAISVLENIKTIDLEKQRGNPAQRSILDDPQVNAAQIAALAHAQDSLQNGEMLTSGWDNSEDDLQNIFVEYDSQENNDISIEKPLEEDLESEGDSAFEWFVPLEDIEDSSMDKDVSDSETQALLDQDSDDGEEPDYPFFDDLFDEG